jgi:hypothetical protein
MELRLGPVPLHASYTLGRSRLSEGTMSAPSLSPDTITALHVALGKIMDGFVTEVQALQEEFDLASPPAIRVDPQSATQISKIGSLPPQEIRVAIEAAARQLGDLAGRVLSGSLGVYLTPDQAQSIQASKTTADQLVLALENQDQAVPPAEHRDQIQGYLDMHAADLSARVKAAEQGVVQAEAGSVPVLEPSEKNVGLNIAIGVGILTVAGLVVWKLVG